MNTQMCCWARAATASGPQVSLHLLLNRSTRLEHSVCPQQASHSPAGSLAARPQHNLQSAEPPPSGRSLRTTYTKPQPPAALTAGRPETHKNAARLKAALNLRLGSQQQQQLGSLEAFIHREPEEKSQFLFAICTKTSSLSESRFNNNFQTGR